ncbi:hypothetical protein P154DRAFT_522140 [Amniculicola lignicola CBS 123094]|uniref:F-box domain-containing protein n=1 Tax=Amniculicola lignicola CBS 123094 TaxID=1392246 RepID=A0A6A5WIL5_9PLEO|nr:hypothetical protein P154DRAFT_522140 [Amniculicola lignicola CBS 123094]
MAQSKFQLLSLPAELRIQIYEDCFALPCEVDATLRIPSPQPFLIPGALLRTCKQVYREANAILYSQNTFRVGENPSDASFGLAWLNRIGPKNAQLIRKVVVEIRKSKASSRLLPFLVLLFELRGLAPNLQELSVFLGEKHTWRRRTHQEMLGTEIARYKKLKKLVLGGDHCAGVGFPLPETYVNMEQAVEFAPLGSVAFNERKEMRARWVQKIEADEIRIREERANHQWDRAQRKNIDMMVKDRIQAQERCPCDECEVRNGLQIPKVSLSPPLVQHSNWPNCSCFECWLVMQNQRGGSDGLSQRVVIDEFPAHVEDREYRLAAMYFNWFWDDVTPIQDSEGNGEPTPDLDIRDTLLPIRSQLDTDVAERTIPYQHPISVFATHETFTDPGIRIHDTRGYTSSQQGGSSFPTEVEISPPPEHLWSQSERAELIISNPIESKEQTHISAEYRRHNFTSTKLRRVSRHWYGKSPLEENFLTGYY